MKASGIPLLTQVSGAHLVSHLHIMALPALLPLLPSQMGVGFVELGLALSVFNVVSALVQAPMGFVVDRFGARRVLTIGLLFGSFCFLSLGLAHNYLWLVVAMGLAGVANGVYHPADYALLSTGIEPTRIGRAFSIHTFAGYIGAAIAPGLLLGIAAWAGTRGAFACAGLAGLAAAGLMLTPTRPSALPRAAPAAGATERAASPAARRSAKSALARIVTPAILSLTVLFVLLSLSTGAIQNFSVAALVTGYGVALPVANVGLSAFLFASAFGVLAGGALADRTRRHGAVAAIAFGITAMLVATVALFDLPGFLLVTVLGLAGFLSGVIAPSRDMMVRAAAAPGTEGRVFGVVSTGFNIGGAVGPVLFGWLLDGGRPHGVFWAAVVFMVLVVALTLEQERRAGRSRIDAMGNLASRSS
ncbi:MAG: MFS transporter [Gammaproteobacteria bacterium]